MLYASGQNKFSPTSQFLPWQYAHTGAHYTWSQPVPLLRALGLRGSRSLGIFPRIIDYDHQAQLMIFEHRDRVPANWILETRAPYWNEIYTLPPIWTAGPYSLLDQVARDIPGCLGKDPVAIPFPMKMELHPERDVSPKPKKFKVYLMGPDLVWWLATRPRNHPLPEFSCWSWVAFWRSQVQYWVG